MAKLYYSLMAESMTADMILNNPKSPCMFSKLPAFAVGIKNHFDSIVQTGNIYPAITAKVCPGIKDLVNNSIKIVTPSDIIMQYNNQGFTGESACGVIEVIPEHGPEQTHLPDGSNILEKTFNVKIKLPIMVSTTVDMLLLDADWHNGRNTREWYSVPGIYPAYFSSRLNIIMTVPYENSDTLKIIKIPANTTLAYFWNDRKIKLVEKEKITQSFKSKYIGQKYRDEKSARATRP